MGGGHQRDELLSTLLTNFVTAVLSTHCVVLKQHSLLFSVHCCSRLFTVVQSLKWLGRDVYVYNELVPERYKCGTNLNEYVSIR